MNEFRLTCTGTQALLMHNSRLADPLDEITKLMKPLNAKRNKTDEDYERLAYLEFLGGLYYDERGGLGPYLPGENFERCLHDAAKITKSGKKIERGVFIKSNINMLEYAGPRGMDDLWKDKNYSLRSSAKVGMNRVMRTRPYFREWSVFADGIYDPSEINLAELQQIAQTAGLRIGLGDWRPRYGRFEAVIEEREPNRDAA